MALLSSFCYLGELITVANRDDAGGYKIFYQAVPFKSKNATNLFKLKDIG